MLIKKISYLFVFLLILLTARSVGAGLGISPSRLTADHLLRGSVYEKTFTLSSSEPKETLDFKVVTEGRIKDWLFTDKGVEFTWPVGKQKFPVTVIVEAPVDTPNGSYQGTIRFISSPKPSEQTGGSGTVVALAAAIQVDLTISGKQVLEYALDAINIESIEQGFFPKIRILVNNTGNVRAKPSKVQVEIYDKFKEALLASQDITEMGFVAPFKRDEIIIELSIDLSIGQYWAVVSVYRDDLLLKEDSLVFEVLEPGSLQKQAKESEFNAEKAVAAIGMLNIPVIVIIGLLILIIIILAVVLFKRQRR